MDKLFVLPEETISAYYEKDIQKLKEEVYSMPSYTYTSRYKDLLVFTQQSPEVVILTLKMNESNSPKSLYEIISLVGELATL